MPTTSPPSKEPQKQLHQEASTSQANEMGRCVILKEDVNPDEIKKSDLTCDCYFVYRTGGKVDVAKGSMVHIFDDYYDRGITLTKIDMSGGSLNPKLNKPNI